jgi:CspA family cold shock protein
MPTGRVKWFDNKKGYGFIVQEGGKDIFVHRTEVRSQGDDPKILKEGETVQFEVVEAERGLKAVQVSRLS